MGDSLSYLDNLLIYTIIYDNCTARKDLGTSLALQYYAGHVGSGAGGDLV